MTPTSAALGSEDAALFDELLASEEADPWEGILPSEEPATSEKVVSDEGMRFEEFVSGSIELEAMESDDIDAESDSDVPCSKSDELLAFEEAKPAEGILPSAEALASEEAATSEKVVSDNGMSSEELVPGFIELEAMESDDIDGEYDWDVCCSMSELVTSVVAPLLAVSLDASKSVRAISASLGDASSSGGIGAVSGSDGGATLSSSLILDGGCSVGCSPMEGFARGLTLTEKKLGVGQSLRLVEILMRGASLISTTLSSGSFAGGWNP